MSNREHLTAEKLAELRGLAEDATPGPWFTCYNPKDNMIEGPRAEWVIGLEEVLCPFLEGISETCGKDASDCFDCPKHVAVSPQDLDYIAAANPHTLLALIDEVDRLRAREEWLIKHILEKDIFICPMPEGHKCEQRCGFLCCLYSSETESRRRCWRMAADMATRENQEFPGK